MTRDKNARRFPGTMFLAAAMCMLGAVSPLPAQ